MWFKCQSLRRFFSFNLSTKPIVVKFNLLTHATVSYWIDWRFDSIVSRTRITSFYWTSDQVVQNWSIDRGRIDWYTFRMGEQIDLSDLFSIFFYQVHFFNRILSKTGTREVSYRRTLWIYFHLNVDCCQGGPWRWELKWQTKHNFRAHYGSTFLFWF